MGARTFDVVTAIVVVAGIFVLVRPKSQGPALVNTITGGLNNLVKSATGGGTWG